MAKQPPYPTPKRSKSKPKSIGTVAPRVPKKSSSSTWGSPAPKRRGVTVPKPATGKTKPSGYARFQAPRRRKGV